MDESKSKPLPEKEAPKEKSTHPTIYPMTKEMLDDVDWIIDAIKEVKRRKEAKLKEQAKAEKGQAEEKL